jgi:hypothetical protein
MIVAVTLSTALAAAVAVPLIALLVAVELLRAGSDEDPRIRTLNWAAFPLLALFAIIVAARLVSFV